VKKEIFTIRKKIQPYKNILSGFKSWKINSNAVGVATIKSDFEMEFIKSVGTPASVTSPLLSVLPNTNYTLDDEGNYGLSVYESPDGISFTLLPRSVSVKTFTTAGTTKFLLIEALVGGAEAGTFSFINPILVSGVFSELEFIPKDESVIRERLKDNGQVQEVRVRFYPGVERTLQVSPYVLHKNNRREDFFTYPEGTEPYITGDNDYLIFPCSLDFQYDDEICIEYNHAGGSFPYTLAVDVVVTYHEAEVIA
jgi:hypothetical protein